MPLPASFDHLGRYAVQRRLGAGGFATVWLAYDEKLDSPVAIKVLADNWAGDDAVARRFLEEGRYLRRVDSPHVVSVYDAGELSDGRPYLVMTYADQGTLADRIDMQTMGGSLDIPQARSVVEEVASGLQDLHDRDILHRDVKPANVLFRSVRGRGAAGRQVRALVGDLGLGKALDVSSRLTMIAGTPSYVAPEQAAGEPLDARADQYSLAALAYRLLTGRPAFVFNSLHEAATPRALEPLSAGPRRFSDEVEQVVRRGLAPQRDDRFESVGDFGEALSAALGRMGAGTATVDLLPAPVVEPVETTPPTPVVEPVETTPPTRQLPDAEATPDVAPSPFARAHAEPRVRPSGSAPLPDASVRPALPPREGERPLFADEAPPAPAVRPAPQPSARPARRRRWPAVVGTVLAMLVAGGAAGAGAYVYAGDQRDRHTVRVTDVTKAISVRVPGSWDAYTNGDGWRPPSGKTLVAALSVGEQAGWNHGSTKAQGVFAGLLPTADLPTTLPGHAGCNAIKPVWTRGHAGAQSLTAIFTGCPGGVIVERVTKVADGRLLWTQVQASGQATAYEVLDSVRLG